VQKQYPPSKNFLCEKNLLQPNRIENKTVEYIHPADEYKK
jgi:hypothetical protein